MGVAAKSVGAAHEGGSGTGVPAVSATVSMGMIVLLALSATNAKPPSAFRAIPAGTAPAGNGMLCTKVLLLTSITWTVESAVPLAKAR